MAIFSIRSAKDLGVAIRARRKELGLDQASLAKRVGVSRKWIIEIEKGKPRASVELVLRTLNLLGIQFTTPSKSETTSPDIDAVFEKLQGHDE